MFSLAWAWTLQLYSVGGCQCNRQTLSASETVHAQLQWFKDGVRINRDTIF